MLTLTAAKSVTRIKLKPAPPFAGSAGFSFILVT